MDTALEVGGAPPPVQARPSAPRPREPPPSCLSNVVQLCELKDMALRGFVVTSRHAAVQAHKWALLKVGLASCWRTRALPVDGAGVFAHGGQPRSGAGGLAGAAGTALSTLNPQAAVYEVWAFGTRPLLAQLTQDQVKAAGGEGGGGSEFGRLGVHESVVTTDMAAAIRSPSCPDALLLLNDAMGNRADLLLGGWASRPGLVRMGDSWVPRMDQEDAVHRASLRELPAIHLHCFVRGTELMATITVKMKRLQHLEEFDTIGTSAKHGQRLPACGIEVVMSPYGVAGLLKSVRPSQLLACDDLMSRSSQKQMQESGWGELEAGNVSLSDVTMSSTLCKSRMAVVEVGGDAQLYPAHRIVRMSPSPLALVPQLDNMLSDDSSLDHLVSSTEKREGRETHLAPVRHMYAMLRAGARGGTARLACKYLPPVNGYWVFAGIAQQCLKLLVSDKPAKGAADSAVALQRSSSAGTAGVHMAGSGQLGTHGADHVQQGVGGWVDPAAKDGQAPADAKKNTPAPAAAAAKKGQKRKTPVGVAAVAGAAGASAGGTPTAANKRTKKGKAGTAAAAAAAAAAAVQGQAEAADDDGELLLCGGGGDTSKKTTVFISTL